jgi:L-arabinonolactonase
MTRFEILPGSLARCRLGEGPWWSAAGQYLYWIDALGQRVHGSTLDGGRPLEIAVDGTIGFAIPDAEDSLVVGLRRGVFRLDRAGNELERIVRPDYDEGTHHINDGITDHRGRLWFGTMHDAETAATGELFSFADGRLRVVRTGVTTSNGIGFSPDGTVMYYADSPARTITRFRYNMETGDATNPEPFVTDVDGFPDGLTVDAEGCVWSAKWDGGRVMRYDPNGRIIGQLDLPVSRPTSCMFAGPDLALLAITSAQPDPGRSEPLAGSVFLVESGTHGIAETPFAG